MTHCRFLPHKDTVAVANSFVRPINMNTDTVTVSLDGRHPSVPRSRCRHRSLRHRPHHRRLAAPCRRCRRATTLPRAFICVSHIGLQILETALHVACVAIDDCVKLRQPINLEEPSYATRLYLSFSLKYRRSGQASQFENKLICLT